jgi:hypothetical protein
MDAKKLLVGVATTALGFALGMYLGKMLMKGGAKSTPSASTTTTPSAATEFGYDGGDDDNDY